MKVALLNVESLNPLRAASDALILANKLNERVNAHCRSKTVVVSPNMKVTEILSELGC